MKLNCARIQLAFWMPVLVLLQACSSISGPVQGEMPPAMPLQAAIPESGHGSNYHPATSRVLFGDVRARNVGDTLTVRLAERTQASKSASTGISKDSSFNSGTPIFGGDPVTLNGNNILNNSWNTTQSFDGAGSSRQSNSLSGDITVTVQEVYPNGNLLVRGEKWIELNQGKEYLRVTGIVRPVDIGTDNAVFSSQIADASISYSGKGDIANANRPGGVARLFNRFWPL